MAEEMEKRRREGKWERVIYTRYADDMVVLIDGHPRWQPPIDEIRKRLEAELKKVEVASKSNQGSIDQSATDIEGAMDTAIRSFAPHHLKRLVLISDDLQPSFRAATAPARGTVLDVGRTPAAGADDYFWLDPTKMQKAVNEIAAAMEAANRSALAPRATSPIFSFREWRRCSNCGAGIPACLPPRQTVCPTG